jgi:hypothetical protein
MRHWPWRSLLLAVAGVFLLAVLLVPDPRPHDLSSLSAGELVELLASPRQVVREAAAGQLIVRGKTVAPDLAHAAATASGAPLKEIVQVLEELMLSSDLLIAESAETALEELANSHNRSAADRANRVLNDNCTLRHTRALVQVERLGGVVLMAPGNESAPEDTGLMVSASSRSRPSTRVILLDQDWQGGDAGLKYITRIGLFPRDPLSLHVSDDAPVSEDALRNLRAQRQNTQVRRPNQGCLGVSYSEEAPDPVVGGVIADSPADRAGLRPGDWISHVDDQEVTRFSQVAARARTRQPGDVITLIVRRGDEVHLVAITLGSDFGTGVCRCVEEVKSDQ